MRHRLGNFTPLILPIALGVCGCTTTGESRSFARGQLFEVSQLPSARSLPGRTLGEDVCKSPSAADLEALRQRFDKTLSGCSTVLSGYQSEAKQAQRTLAGLAIVGTVAGSIVVPALVAKATFSKSAVAAWSGLAGATNFAQHALVNEGLGPTDLIKVREGIRSNLSQAIDKFTSTASDYCARENALANMAAACINYEMFSPGQVVNESTPPTPPGGTKTAGNTGPQTPPATAQPVQPAATAASASTGAPFTPAK